MMTHKHSDKVPEKPMTPLEKLKAAEKLWLEGSDEEDFYFSAFCQPKRLRRSRRFPARSRHWNSANTKRSTANGWRASAPFGLELLCRSRPGTAASCWML